MPGNGTQRPDRTHIDPRLGEFASLSYRILLCGIHSVLRVDFLREISKILLECSGCDEVELRLREGGQYHRFVADCVGRLTVGPEEIRGEIADGGKTVPWPDKYSQLEQISLGVLVGKYDPGLSYYTSKGSFWTPDATTLADLRESWDDSHGAALDIEYPSLAMIPFTVDGQDAGLLQLRSTKPDFFTEPDVEYFEFVAQILGVALAYRRRGLALRERIKELTCLNEISSLVVQPGISLEEILAGIADYLPPAWLYPEVTCGRVVFDGRSYETEDFERGVDALASSLIVKGEHRGFVEVIYTEEMPRLDEGPFLKEERELIDTIARDVSIIIEHKLAEEEKWALQDQLRHADRLATIGQLAAGVAHELNEPLGSILGFAQLMARDPELEADIRRDVNKITSASLHAREVIKKLMTFARQTPPKVSEVDLNEIIEGALYFFEARCARAGIELQYELSPSLPTIIGDQAQLNQVLVNLVVNSIQAMPEGGILKICTEVCDNTVSLIVEDNGVGMSKDMLNKVFLPFFTTKDIDEGTGLGLAVVHGIVMSHRGSIEVESEIGKGARFVIRLPRDGESDSEESATDVMR